MGGAMSLLDTRAEYIHHETMAPVFEQEVQALRRELTLKNEIIKLLTKELHNVRVNRVGQSRKRLQQVSTR
jgi:hypothetical protein